MSDVNLQRSFISVHLTAIKRKRYLNSTNRNENQAFHFELNDAKVRVCKLFFINTLGISDRVIRTIIKKIQSGYLEIDKRGKHNNHPTVDTNIQTDIMNHIESIPRIDSHYLRAQTTKQFIEGGKTIADLHRDYKKLCEENNKQAGNYLLYRRIFYSNFNISFFIPKKDQCALCERKKNTPEQDENLTKMFEDHLNEKDLARLKKQVS